ncbi:diguanylate cyclase [Vibrio cholerae]|uniref:sensor domain-containing diguanylate cyclase n=1 Tax=Vibrio cholerae TaxID=666 RepID=UPI0000F34E4D|nr:sensor domain-containing diguanylate cyclase [Vibrio cholerae]EAZ74995.1 chemotaxis protein [Vibrio cholerae NCTC 8457]APF81242.1 diguanylate cyclase [Vibrio cholerae]EGR0665356.1 diguanylate cyclase [Vibrio cholerae]EGR4435037.1 diguanylate cyclase [Vibrio cholerae]EJR5449842.1 sensor domain-containing diguanylate cyclase [Vibrio cholerae]
MMKVGGLISIYDSDAKLLALDKVYAIAEIDLLGNICNINENFSKILKYSYEELIGKPYSTIFNDFDKKNISSFWKGVLSGEIKSGDFLRIDKYGIGVWLNASYTQIKDSSGNVIGILKLATDITEKRQVDAYNKSRIDAIYRSQSVIELDLDGHITDVNSNYCELSGYKRDEILGIHHRVLCPKNFLDSEDYINFWQKLENGEFIRGRFERIRRDNQVFWIQASYNPIFDSSGKVYKVIKYAYDITEAVKNEKLISVRNNISELMLKIQEEFLVEKNLTLSCNKVLTSLLKTINCDFGFVGIVRKIYNEDLISIPAIVNSYQENYVFEYLGIKNDEVMGLYLKRDNVFFDTKKMINNQYFRWDIVHSSTLSKNKEIYSFLGIPVKNNPNTLGFLVIASVSHRLNDDLVETLNPLVTMLGGLIYARELEDNRSLAEEQLRFNAEHDFLTGLPNRSSFFQHAELIFNLLNNSVNGKDNTCIAILDIDKFKDINDSYGHVYGDSILKQTADLLSKQFRDIDILARMGGEEFIILLKATNLPLAFKIIERCREIIEKHSFNLSDETVNLTISAGLAQFSKEYKTLDEWIHAADCKLYESKHCGRNIVSM